MLTITSISTGITSLIFLLCGAYLYFSWKRKKGLLLGCFTVLLLSIGFQQMFFSLGSGVFAGNFLASNVSWWIAHIFMFFGLGYLFVFRNYVYNKFKAQKSEVMSILRG